MIFHQRLIRLETEFCCPAPTAVQLHTAEVPVMVAASGVSAADLFLLSSAAKPDIGSYAQMVGHVEKSLTLRLGQHKFATLQTL